MKRSRALALLTGALAAVYLMIFRRRTGAESGAPPRLPTWKIVVPIILFLMFAGALIYLMFVNPRMRNQPKATPFQALLPSPPEVTVAVTAAPSLVPSPDRASQLRNPLPDTEQTRRAGYVYYGHYCVFCHGRDGRGNGPVGRSYVPTPTDLTSPPVQNLSDGALYRAMLTGAGHEPVLPYVILPEALWYIVDYVRHLPAREGEQSVR
jgi:mono/diheme cytochrome c family protein